VVETRYRIGSNDRTESELIQSTFGRPHHRLIVALGRMKNDQAEAKQQGGGERVADQPAGY